jgi:hypothetical protein
MNQSTVVVGTPLFTWQPRRPLLVCNTGGLVCKTAVEGSSLSREHLRLGSPTPFWRTPSVA